MKDVVFASDGRELQGRIFRPSRAAHPTSGLLFIHGLNSDQSGYSVRAQAAVAALDVVCLTFDLSGHGRSPGVLEDLTLRDHLHDVIAAYDRLNDEVESPGPIGVCGASYGAYLAVLLIARRQVERLLLRAPALYSDEAFEKPLRERGVGSPSNARIALDNLGRFAGEVLILESGRDEVIPHESIEAYLDACHGRARYEVIPDATHSLTEERWQRQFIETIVRWFGPMVASRRAGSRPQR